MLRITLTPKTKKLTNKDKAVLEVAMMNGNAVRIDNNSLYEVLKYCLPAIPHENGIDAYNLADEVLHKYTKSEHEVFALTFNRVNGMSCITFILQDEFNPINEEVLENWGIAFCYVANLAEPMFSEFGDCEFEKCKRIG